jgi:Kef-type K+ transport system membrane component KefB
MPWLQNVGTVPDHVADGDFLGCPGRIPGFTNTIFPTESLPNLSLVANFGLVFYLFLVGLELDLGLITARAKPAVLVSLAGISLPFAIGSGISFFMYSRLVPNPEEVPFGSFLLFICVAMSITAFPVLARIMSEVRLYGTPVGE